MLDNEAKDVIALMDYDRAYSHGDVSSFIRFVETDETQSWFRKLELEGAPDELNSYSGTNVLLDVIPLKYIKDNHKPRQFNAVMFGVESNLLVVVYDNTVSLPVIGAKVLISDVNDRLIFKKSTDRYGRSYIRKIFKAGEEYTIRISFDGEEKTTSFTFEPDMTGICLS